MQERYYIYFGNAVDAVDIKCIFLTLICLFFKCRRTEYVDNMTQVLEKNRVYNTTCTSTVHAGLTTLSGFAVGMFQLGIWAGLGADLIGQSVNTEYQYHINKQATAALTDTNNTEILVW